MQEVYQNPRRISPGIQHEFRMAIIDDNFRNSPPMFIAEGHEVPPDEQSIMRELVLHRYRSTLHITYEMLSDVLADNRHLTQDNRGAHSNLEFVNRLLHAASQETQRRLDMMQPKAEGHPIILDRVRTEFQESSCLLLIDIEFWAVQNRDTHIINSVFERTVHEVLTGTLDTESIIESDREAKINQLIEFQHQYSSIYANEKKYNIDSEEAAHELLKTMLSEKQFELYKKEGYVIVKGTYGRMYKVKKGDMIEVEQKRLGSKRKSYRLCLEPRDRGTICPTDEVIAKIKLIQANEKKLHEIGNKFDGTEYTQSYSPKEWATVIFGEQLKKEDILYVRRSPNE